MNNNKPMAEWIYENVERDLDKNVMMTLARLLRKLSKNVFGHG